MGGRVMTFHIGSQQAGTINNVGRDQTITGDQVGVISTADALAAVRDLRAGLETSAMSADARVASELELGAITYELHRPEPDKPEIASRLAHVVQLAAGAISTGSKIATSIATLAHWLGPAGAALAALL
jgi:hypothetical protein